MTKPPDDSTATPTRQPGRPRSNRIDFFNVDTLLDINPKFTELQELLDITPEKAWYILTRLFCYVARYEAITGSIANAKPSQIAKFCNFNKKPELLFDALIKARFLNDDLSVTNWEQNQPHVSKKLANYKAYSLSRDSDSFSAETHLKELKVSGKGREEERNRREEEKKKSPENGLSSSPADTPSAIDLAINDFAVKYNKVAEKHPALRKVRIPLTPGLRKKLETRLKEPEFNTDKVLTALHNSKFYHGDNDRNWAASLAWIVENAGNYVKILSAAVVTKTQSHPIETQKPPAKCPICQHELRDNEWCTNCDYTTEEYAKKFPNPIENAELKKKKANRYHQKLCTKCGSAKIKRDETKTTVRIDCYDCNHVDRFKKP